MGLRKDLPGAPEPESELTEAWPEAWIEAWIEAWAPEISRRLQEVRDGSAELVSLDDVKRRMQERRAARQRPAR